MKRLLTLVLASAAALVLAAPASAGTLTYIDLETSGASGSDGTLLFLQGETGPSGTGIFPAFSRVQANGNESGLSTQANILDNTADNTHNFSILKSDLAALTCTTAAECPGGTVGAQYYVFHLDINESGGNNGDPYLVLDDFQLRYDDTANNNSVASTTLAYNMPDNIMVLMLYDLEAGSGKADVTVLIPISALAVVPNTNYVYLFSSFGHLTDCVTSALDATQAAKCTSPAGPHDYTSSDGFEEWNFVAGQGGTFVPDGGSTLGLLGLGMLSLGYARRRFGKN